MSERWRAARLNPAYRREELEFYFGDLRPKALIVEVGAAGPAVDVARSSGVAVLEVRRGEAHRAGQFSLVRVAGERETAPRALGAPPPAALLLHTSGTTSRPKLVPLLNHSRVSTDGTSVCWTVAANIGYVYCVPN